MSSTTTILPSGLPVGPITPELLAVARGEASADKLLTNAKIINVFTRQIEAGNVAIHKDRIAGVGDYTNGKETIDLNGAFLAPGFIDAHMHVESTSLPPSQFVRLALPHGTTGVVLDPHEIANVLGLPGIRYIMEDAADLPINAMFALSSCVPSSHLETSGARLEAADLAPLFDDPRVVALAEMMNFPGVVHADANVLAKVNLGLARRIVDGHSPGLRGKPLQAYLAAGISSDHECTTAAEALEKLSRGMRIYIREGSAARNLEALLPAITPYTISRFCFCTDDRHPGDLADEGHIDHIVRKAIKLGLEPIAAITIATLNPAMHYRKRDLGAIAPGYFADLIVFDNLQDPRPRLTYFHGKLAAMDGAFIESAMPAKRRPKPPHSPLRLPPLSESSFAMQAKPGVETIRVIGMDPHQLLTANLTMTPKIVEGRYVSDTARDILKLCVIERHRARGNIGRGFITGFGLKSGAIASTVGHDSHNLAILGANDADMLAAARALEACGGGQCAVKDGNVLALFPLPIAGLMSDQPAAIVIQQQRALMAAAQSLGCPHHDPFMPLSFMPLPVIPSLKLSDLGLVDVDQFKIVPLEA